MARVRQLKDYEKPSAELVSTHKQIVEQVLVKHNSTFVTYIPNYYQHIDKYIDKFIANGITPDLWEEILSAVAPWKFERITTEKKLEDVLDFMLRCGITHVRDFTPNIQKIKAAVRSIYKIDGKFTGHTDIRDLIHNLEIAVTYLVNNKVITSKDPYKDILAVIRKRNHEDITDLAQYLQTYIIKVHKHAQEVNNKVKRG